MNKGAIRGLSALGIAAALALLLVSGCGPSQEQLRLNRAMYAVRHELHPDYADAMAILESKRNGKDGLNESVQYGMCQTTAAALGGDYADAERVSYEAFVMVQKYENKDRETLAALGNEGVKFFKGEPHERSMLCYYAGLARYLRGEYNEARMFFTQALNAAKTRDEDAKEFRDDFPLGYYWLGRTLLKRDEVSDARAAFERASVTLSHHKEAAEAEKLKSARAKQYKDELESEKLGYQNNSQGKNAVPGIVDLSKETTGADAPAALPQAAAQNPVQRTTSDFHEFLTTDYQREANLVVMIETGAGPFKFAKDSSSAYDEVGRPPYREAAVDIYVDGYRAGRAFRLSDTYHQAMTRGVESRRARQRTKAITKAVLKNMPYVGMVASYWDIRADLRYWPTLAGEYHVFAGKLTPGPHTVHFRFYDINDKYLPRYDITRHFICIPSDNELVMTVHSVENQDNAYLLTFAPSAR